MNTCTFSPCRTYRYSLVHEWDRDLPRVAFIMLNPSTADENALDPTLRRCLGFARSWGYGSFEIGNVFAFRATDPKAMKAAADPFGPEAGEVGDFVGLADGSFRRMRVGEMVIDDAQ